MRPVFPLLNFNFVEDTCDAIIKLGESSKTYGETYNIASKYFIQIKQITDLISQIMNKKVKVKTVKERTRKK